MYKYIIALIAALAIAAPANAAADPKVTLCHATGSATNPYVMITVAAAGAYNGHLGAHGDIIPEFTFRGETYGPEGDQSILAAGCKVETDEEQPPEEPKEEPEEKDDFEEELEEDLEEQVEENGSAPSSGPSASGGDLPYTGLPAWLALAGGLGLIGAGLRLRK